MPEHRFIVPDLQGPPSGGTLYNRELLRELKSLGTPASTLEPDLALAALQAGEAGVYWVDTLFLEHFEALWRANRQRRVLGLLAHYLPSLVAQGDAVPTEGLRRDEAFALAHCDVVLAPSGYLKRALIRLGLAAPCFVVEPGCLTHGLAANETGSAGVRALMIANLTPGKGVEPFLRALSQQLRAEDAFQLEIVGRLDLDAACARACQNAVQEHAELSRRVVFSGGLSPTQVSERLLASNLLISASRMESFGMAVADALTVGVPVVALGRGNVIELVDAAAGGVLAASDDELALACLTLARDASAHARAVELAQSRPRRPRSFADAAADFVRQVSASDLAERA
ncbi:MAG TPA: glycosyltransferase family 4 protein [Polyangiaceae bacterium]|nr:glycosyltransferase family 4 protein [Polyangiaceae bacterium]